MGQQGDPWHARIEDGSTGVHGAGALITESYVLTCAHVVERAQRVGQGVWVRVEGAVDTVHPATALITKPEWAEHRGDVAVLELASPVRGAPRARLRRTWQSGERVRVFGFPDNVDGGQEAVAEVVTRDFARERVQLNAVSETRVRQGFSGAVVLGSDGAVLGVVTNVNEPTADSCWMIDVPALRKYAASVIDPCLTSLPSKDRRFTRPSADVARTLDGPVPVALTRHLVSWAESGGPGGVCVVTGGATVELVARLVGLTVPEYRRAAPEQTVGGAPSGTLPQVATVDAAIDAEGRTTERIIQELARSLSLSTGPGTDLVDQLEGLGSPVVVVLNAVDAARDPVDLHYRLVQPIALRAPAIGVRLLLGFRQAPPAYLRPAVATDLASAARSGDRVDDSTGQFADRLAELAKRVTRVAGIEHDAMVLHGHVAFSVLGAPEPRMASGTALGVRAGVLRDVGPPAGPADARTRTWFAGELDACERMAETALTRITGFRRRLDDLLARRNRLRNRLAAFRSLAADAGLLEELYESYDAAARRLDGALCDLDLAERDVQAYYAAVTHATGGGSR